VEVRAAQELLSHHDDAAKAHAVRAAP
jgi:hypothetical protein